MNKEKDLILLISFVAIGVIIASGLVVVFQTIVVIPVLIFGIIMFPLILLQNKKKFIHLAENLEKVIFFITLVIIAVSFAILYKPI
jgi:energy-converting hydrogenase A subunit K